MFSGGSRPNIAILCRSGEKPAHIRTWKAGGRGHPRIMVRAPYRPPSPKPALYQAGALVLAPVCLPTICPVYSIHLPGENPLPHTPPTWFMDRHMGLCRQPELSYTAPNFGDLFRCGHVAQAWPKGGTTGTCVMQILAKTASFCWV